ncbi:MAG TPA: DUF1573 domain-containing protein [Ignavibacteria bacterium]|nr:DUF1573 domain-containing protein [Ignavibacteria bacterium]HMQ98195.1 DUF1573 domain-containing protein [Ignavibacteria bacterium]
MKKLVLVLIFFPVLLFSQSGPKIEIVGGDNINTGNHRRGQELTYEITFKNVGDQDLQVTSVQTSCGCSSALASTDAVKPGESGTIKFTYNGLGMGSVTKAVMVTTNENGNSTKNIMLTMNMVDPLTLNPGSIVTEGKVGDELKQKASIVNSMDKEIDITEITSNTPVIKISADKMALMSGETSNLDISIKIYEESAINAAIIIKTTEGEFQIPVLVDVKAN